MTVSKIAVSIPVALVRKARRAVEIGRAESVSAYVASAMAEKAKNEDLADLLREMLAEMGGPMTTAERGEADRMLGLSARKRKPRAA